MSKMVHMTVRVEEEIAEQLNNFKDEQSKSSFIRSALKNELSGTKRSVKEFSNMAKSIEELNGDLLQQKVYDLEIKMQILLEEVLKQNEILKLIHRRITITTKYGENMIDHLKENGQVKYQLYDEAIEIVNEDLEKINFN